ncbi:MAG: nucleoside triphosphate pyrophosphohydrolase [Acidobacteria bacterium]|nr:nucleoside triphosphate pyrophosphohydrolase [Acidobacteriota bacterium]
MSESTPTAGERFQQLVDVMAKLRSPGGCPWDREQSFDSIKPYTLEETYEVLDAIDNRDWRALCEELGDFLLQAVFYAQMAAEEGLFRIEDSLDAICTKLIRRHPHVFADGDAATPGQVKARWDQIKEEEQKERGEEPKGLLDNIPRAMPALVQAQQISSKVAAAGFDWENLHQVSEKVREELAELERARAGANPGDIEAEIGDLFFTLVNLARFLKTDPEQALRKTNAKFRRRFAYVERGLAVQGKTPAGSSIEEMEALWRQAKAL